MLAFPNFFNKGYSTLLTTGMFWNTALAAVTGSTGVVMFSFFVSPASQRESLRRILGNQKACPMVMFPR
jgi:hypothetical protein